MAEVRTPKGSTWQRDIVDHVRPAAAWIDDDGRLVHANEAWRATHGNGLLAGAMFELGAKYAERCAASRADDPRLCSAVNDALLAIGRGDAEELTLTYRSLAGGLDLDGAILEPRLYAVRLVRILGPHGSGVLVTHRTHTLDLYGPADSEISTQRTIDLELANERLREEQRRQRGILDSIPDIAWLKDQAGRYLAVNKRFTEAVSLEAEAIVGRSDDDLFDPVRAEKYREGDLEVMESTRMRRVEERLSDPIGNITAIETIKVPIVSDDGHVIGTAGIARDITERVQAEVVLRRSNAELEALVERRTEEVQRANERLRADILARERAEEERRRLEHELLQSQKLEGIGRLAGGIAHDFNNLLTIILTYGHQTLTKIEPSSKVRPYVREMVAAAQRAADLTRQLLAFARKQLIEPRIVDLNGIVLATDGMLRPLLGAGIEIVTLPARDPCTVRVDPGQFERILLNLAANARDAMPGGGKLVIATGHTNVEASSALARAGLAPGAYVRLAVSDDGAGIEPEVLPNIFDPFFTTKATGDGTGLGLATCYGIVKQASGHISVESTRGAGTTFEIYLPSVREIAGAIAEPQSFRATNGNETILLVEDEPRLRAITAEVLREEGYEVLLADSGLEAIRVVEQSDKTIDLVVTDMVMPHMSGRVAVEKILTVRPDLKVLFISGYAASTSADGGVDERFPFLAKPYTREALLESVRALLDTGSRSTDSTLDMSNE